MIGLPFSLVVPGWPGVAGRIANFNPLWFFLRRTLEVDFENSSFFWAGAAKTLGDLTETANGYTLTDVAWRRPPGTTYLIEWEDDPSASAETCMFALDNGGTGRIEFTTQSGVSLGIPRVYYNPPGQYSQHGSAASAGLRGRNRLVVSVPEGGSARMALNGLNGSTISAVTLGVPTGLNRVSFNYRARFNDMVFGGTLHKVIATPRLYTLAQLEAIAAYDGPYSYHLLGDSFLNSSTSLLNEIKIDLQAAWRMPSQDGVGGSTLVDQAVRFAAAGRYHASTLIIMDGGLSDSGANAISAINSMVSKLSHSRWLYVEPGYGTDQIAGSGNRTTQDATVAAIAAEFPGNYLPTLTDIQACNDGSPEDLDDVNVSDIWPRSLRSDALHPGTVVNGAGHSGYSALAGIISAELVSRGW